MYGKKITLYDVLEVSSNAKQTDIVRAYRKLSGHLQKDTAAPDRKREALLREAYEILSDPERRVAYDKSIRKPFLVVTNEHDRPAKWIAAIAGLIVMAIALYLAFRSERDPVGEPLPVSQIASTTSVATGRLSSIDISGKVTPLGLAFAIAPGVMVASCHGLEPGAQLLVHILPRALPARVASTEGDLGICKLTVDGVGSWPLLPRGFGPHVSERIYATNISPGGELVLQEGVVKRVVNEPKVSIIETSRPVTPGAEGGPLLDMRGRVVGLAVPSRYIALPRAWVDDEPKRRAPAPTQPQDRVVDAPSSREEATGRKVDSLKAARDEAIDKAAAWGQ